MDKRGQGHRHFSQLAEKACNSSRCPPFASDRTPIPMPWAFDEFCRDGNYCELPKARRRASVFAWSPLPVTLYLLEESPWELPQALFCRSLGVVLMDALPLFEPLLVIVFRMLPAPRLRVPALCTRAFPAPTFVQARRTLYMAKESTVRPMGW